MAEYYGPRKNDATSIIKWLLLGIVIIAILIFASFALGWIQTPLETISASNVQQLSREANDAWQALQAQRQNIASIEGRSQDMLNAYGEDQQQWPQGKRDEYLQLRQQYTNFITAYNGSCAQYNALWQDEWRAIPAPDDLPTRCELYSAS